jgi:hypothetical protein
MPSSSRQSCQIRQGSSKPKAIVSPTETPQMTYEIGAAPVCALRRERRSGSA